MSKLTPSVGGLSETSAPRPGPTVHAKGRSGRRALVAAVATIRGLCRVSVGGHDGNTDDASPDQTRSTQEQSVVARAIDRHAAWARDYAIAGDLDSALDELRDIRALHLEETAENPDHRGSCIP